MDSDSIGSAPSDQQCEEAYAAPAVTAVTAVGDTLIGIEFTSGMRIDARHS